jgi:hypothetical protein
MAVSGNLKRLDRVKSIFLRRALQLCNCTPERGVYFLAGAQHFIEDKQPTAFGTPGLLEGFKGKRRYKERDIDLEFPQTPTMTLDG